MIITQNSELKVMQVLVKYWYRDFSAYELAKESKVSAPMVYKTLDKLNKLKIIAKKESKVIINLSNHFSYSFKLLYDAERLSELPEETQSKINNIFNILKSEYKSDLLGFIVFGSVASGETDKNSDIDLLIIIKEAKNIDYRKKGLLTDKINIIEKTKNEFENEYLLAHDLILNALMQGIVIFDEGIIRFFLMKPLPHPSNEIIMQKKERLELLKNRLFILLKDQDYKMLVEQLKQYIIEKGRILLLQKNIIPHSKKHIISYLKTEEKKLYNIYQTANERNIKEVLKNDI